MTLSLSFQELCMCSAAAGVASHIGYFIRGEHHLEAVWLFRLSIVLPVVVFAALQKLYDSTPTEAAKLTAGIFAPYTLALWTSMTIYRLFFHRLRAFPGPVLARISKSYHVFRVAKRVDNCRQLDQLHKQYGDIVRVGPSELSIITPQSVQAILGPGSKCTKAAWYDMGLPTVSMHTTRSKILHDKRRRVWDQGFGAKALRAYEGRVLGYTNELVSKMSSLSGQALDLSLWFNYYAFDVMGDIAFGKSFSMLQTGTTHFAIKMLHRAQRPVGLFGPTPWAFMIVASLPFVASEYKRFLKWCEDQVEERKKMHMDEPDVMSRIIEASQTGSASEKDWLQGDSRLIIVAGSDTTAATLTHIFYHIAADHTHLQKLRQELDPLAAANLIGSQKDLQSAEYLNGMINETLRLHPPVPSGVLRLTPPDGITIGGTHIPGDTTVSIPSYSIGRSEDVFEKAYEFIPERWTSKPEMIKHKDAFAPFSLGPYSCIGKQLALFEIRTVVAHLVTKFDVTLAPGEDGRSLLQDSKDIFTVELGSLKATFTPRKS